MAHVCTVVVLLTVASAVWGGCQNADEQPPAVTRADIVLPADSEIVPSRVTGGATFGGMLSESRIHPEDVSGIIAALPGVFDPRQLRIDQPWRVERTHDGCVRYLEYELDPERFLLVSARPGARHSFSAEIVQYPIETATEVVRGNIGESTPSLVAAMDAEGETVELPVALAEILAGEIDFNSDLQPGDSFHVMVQKKYREGRFVKYGDVVAAEVMNEDRRVTAVRFQPEGGRAGYYDMEGRSLKRFFLRSPLRFQPQITSRFSRARMHPVLHRVRAHLGVDYRAPVGAPVIAVAGGLVTGAGWRGGGGRTVSIRHASGYESFYLHLSSIAVRRGARVQQGQVIGRVGATGLVSGPHLDYRLKKNGVFVNPLTEHRKLPPGDPVPPSERERFTAARDEALGMLRPGDDAVRVAAQ
jgi:murein DD-endopeptidase MepM/ murein hydrolase activator NlpD